MEPILAMANIAPTVDQIEYHPGLLQEDTIELCRKNDILVEAWSPLGRGHLLDNPVLVEIAGHHGKSPAQVIGYVKEHLDGHLEVAYGLSLGGKILSRIMERNEIVIDHAIIDAAPLLPLPKWLVDPLRYYQSANVWTCYHWTGFWRWVFHSHYFNVLLDECRKVWPYGKGIAVRDGYKDVYTNKLESIHGADIHFWYGSKEAFVAKPQVDHLQKLCPEAHIEVFPKMNHGQLLVDHPEEVVRRILAF